MTEIQIESPLRLPEGWQRTLPHNAVFNEKFASNMTIEEAVRYLQDEVNSVNAHSATLYTNYTALLNERTRSKHGQSEGASLEIAIGAAKGFLACDKWRTLPHNIYALQLAIRHLRLFEEWGIATAEYMLVPFDRRKELRNGMHGSYKADGGVPEWMEVLGLGATATLNDANTIYRQRAKLVAHDENALIILNQAIEQARRALR
jgi:hypothetical protein